MAITDNETDRTHFLVFCRDRLTPGQSKQTTVITRRTKNSFGVQRPEPSCFYNESSSVGVFAGLLSLRSNKYSDRLQNGTSVTDIESVFFEVNSGMRHSAKALFFFSCVLSARFRLF